MKRAAATALVAGGLIVAGAIQTAMHAAHASRAVLMSTVTQRN